MRIRLLKEFRQLLPAWCVAMLLAAVPVQIYVPHDQAEFKLAAYVFGLLCLAVSSFGREFVHRTFPVFLSQPLPRAQLWREKTGTLLVASVAVCLVFLLSTNTRLNPDRGIQWVGLILAPVALAGGLWMTLAFRQIVVAFFFSIGIPSLIAGLVNAAAETWMADWTTPLLCATMLIYAATAFWFARRHFLGAQDYHWTGGEIAFDFKFLGRRSQTGTVPARQSPVWALIKKEFLFQQSSLICALVVAGITLIGVVLGRLTGALLPTATGSSEFFVAFAIGFPMVGCFVLPLLTGALSIAEEHRLGTQDAQQSLPMSRWRQFVVKGAAAFALSIALGAVLTWLLIEAGQVVLGNRGVPSSDHPPFGFLLGAAMVMTSLAFYASSLTRSTIHAVVLTVGLVVISSGAILTSFPYVVRQGMGLGQGGETLLLLIGLPVGLAVLVRLSFSNYCSPADGWRLAWHNVRVWLLSALAVGAVSTGVYHRWWELLITSEAPHGAPRLSLAAPPKLMAAGSRIVVLLSDGRIWMRKVDHQVVAPMTFGTYAIRREKWVWVQGYLNGTNWSDVSVSWQQCLAVRGDGSLWDLTDVTPGNVAGKNAGIKRVGAESDWTQVSCGQSHALALKSDGTLWGWGENNSRQLGMAAKGRIATPIQIGMDSDWVATYAHDAMSLAAKADGSVWRWGQWMTQTNNTWRSRITEQPARWEAFPPHTPISLGWRGIYGVAVKPDGTLWGTGPFRSFAQRLSETKPITEVARAGHEPDWRSAAIVGIGLQIAAIKRDGSLWKSALPIFADPGQMERMMDFARWGKHSDWINVTSGTSSMLALSADGNLWQWDDDPRATLLLAPSRKLHKIANIFEGNGTR